MLIADLEGTLSKILKSLRGGGLLVDDEDVFLWSKDGRSVDFEEANFTEREILNGIQTAARKRVAGIRLNLTVADLREVRVARTRPKRSPPAVTKLALELAEDRGVRVSKPELAAVLAEKLAREIRRTGHLTEAAKRRPLLRKLWQWIVRDRQLPASHQ